MPKYTVPSLKILEIGTLIPRRSFVLPAGAVSRNFLPRIVLCIVYLIYSDTLLVSELQPPYDRVNAVQIGRGRRGERGHPGGERAQREEEEGRAAHVH